MNFNNFKSKNISIITFFLIFGLALFVYNFKEGNYNTPVLFWFLIISILACIVFQISFTKLNKYTSLGIILEILLLTFLIRLLFISTDNLILTGYDAYNELIVLNKISISGWDLGKVTSYGENYPMVFFLSIVFSQLIDISLISVAKWIPLSFFFIAPMFLYLIAKKEYPMRYTLLAFFGFCFLYISFFFHSTLQRETFAVPIFLITIYLYFKSKNIDKNSSNRIMYSCLMIFTAAICALSHHLSAFIMVIFFATFLTVDFLATKYKSLPQKIFRFDRNHTLISITFVALVFCLVFGYWIRLKYSPIEFLADIYKDAAIVNPSGGFTMPSIRYWVLFYGEIIFSILFAIISIIGLFLSRKELKVFYVGFFLYSALMGILMVLTLQGRIIPGEGMGLGSRFETFVYIGFFILAVGTIFQSIKQNNKKIAYLIIALILFFSIFNVYRIPFNLYSDYTPQIGDPRPYVTQQEAISFIWLGLGRNSDNVVIDPTISGVSTLGGIMGEKHGVVPIKRSYKYYFYSVLDPIHYKNYTNYINSSDKIYDNNIISIYYFLIKK